MPMAERDRIETDESRRLAKIILERLVDDKPALQRRIDAGYDLARRMSWEHVVQEYILPAIGRVALEA